MISKSAQKDGIPVVRQCREIWCKMKRETHKKGFCVDAAMSIVKLKGNT
jgi:hypothetical protein